MEAKHPQSGLVILTPFAAAMAVSLMLGLNHWDTEYSGALLLLLAAALTYRLYRKHPALTLFKQKADLYAGVLLGLAAFEAIEFLWRLF